MDDGQVEQRVSCRRCRFRLTVRVPPSEDWRVEVQCPSCDGWACFTPADTYTSESSPLDLEELELDAATRQLAEQLWQPIKEHRGHPAVAWMDRIGNGVFKDDASPPCWPIPGCVYRFTRRRQAAYIWEEGDSWFVRGWHPMRGGRTPPEPVEVFSFETALDRLL